MKTHEHRCVGCGKIIDQGDKIVRALKGVLGEEGDVAKEATWGDFHEPCFNNAVESPQAIYQEILKQSKKNSSKVARKAG